MRVWVVIGGWNHKGFNEPEGIFSKESDAYEYAAKPEVVKRYDYVEVLDYDIDHIAD